MSTPAPLVGAYAHLAVACGVAVIATHSGASWGQFAPVLLWALGCFLIHLAQIAKGGERR